MSKAVITLEVGADGELKLRAEFDPTIEKDMTFDDHPAAFIALKMVQTAASYVGGGDTFYEEDERDDEL